MLAPPWWRKIPTGDHVPVGLIQFDLGSHSGWCAAIEETGIRREAFESRKELQQSLRSAVDGYEFNMHHWAGDGGLFARIVKNSADADQTYEAMAQMFSAFERWRSASSSREGLVCRITGTYIPDLVIDPEPGNWYSSTINQFLKYERQLGRQGTIRITRELRRMLNNSIRNFPEKDLNDRDLKRVVTLPDGVHLSVYQDINHPIRVEESPHSFRYWLNQHKNSLSVVAPNVQLSNLPEKAYQIGDAIVLNASFEDSGYSDINLHTRGTSQIRSDVFKTCQDQDWWYKLSGDLTASHVKGTKFRVHSVTPEFTDDPAVHIYWSQGSYVDSHAFHTMCIASPEVVHRYSADALRVMFEGTNLPNTLSNHSIVVFGTRPRQLLMCHRPRGQRPGTYSRNCWSVSFEE